MKTTVLYVCEAMENLSRIMSKHRQRSRGAPAPQWRGWGAPCTLAPPQLTPVDRNKTYCFDKLVLNLPVLLDIQWPKCFQLQGGFAPLPLDPAGGSAPRIPVIGSCSALANVPPNQRPLPPPVSKWLICDETSIDYVANNWRHQMCSYYCTDFDIDITIFNVDKYRILFQKPKIDIDPPLRRSHIYANDGVIYGFMFYEVVFFVNFV